MSRLHDGFRAMGVALLADAGARCTHPTGRWMVAGLAGWVVMLPLHDGFRAMGVAVLADAGARCTHPTGREL